MITDACVYGRHAGGSEPERRAISLLLDTVRADILAADTIVRHHRQADQHLRGRSRRAGLSGHRPHSRLLSCRVDKPSLARITIGSAAAVISATASRLRETPLARQARCLGVDDLSAVPWLV